MIVLYVNPRSSIIINIRLDLETENFKCTTMNPFGKEQFYEIERSMVCDGVIQCSDGSDELNCPMRSSKQLYIEKDSQYTLDILL